MGDQRQGKGGPSAMRQKGKPSMKMPGELRQAHSQLSASRHDHDSLFHICEVPSLQVAEHGHVWKLVGLLLCLTPAHPT